MNRDAQPLVIKHDETKLKLSSYIIGFGLSLLLTLSAYLLVTHHGASRNVLVGIVAFLALCQFITQTYFFLHLGTESKPRWKIGIFFFMLGVVLILVVGSLWIMYNLNYRVSIPQELKYVKSQDDL